MPKDLPIKTQEALRNVISEKDRIIWVDGVEKNITVLTSVNLEVEAFFAIEETEKYVDGSYAILNYKPKNEADSNSTRISVKLDEVSAHLSSWIGLLHRLRSLNSNKPWFTIQEYDSFTNDLDKILEIVLAYKSTERPEWIIKELSDLKAKIANKDNIDEVSASSLRLVYKINQKLPKLFSVLMKEVGRESISQALQPFFDLIKSIPN